MTHCAVSGNLFSPFEPVLDNKKSCFVKAGMGLELTGRSKCSLSSFMSPITGAFDECC